jgi:hypothetical protein
MTDPTRQETPLTRRRTRPPRVLPIIAAALLLIAGLVGWYLLQRPQLEFSNELAAPIWLAVGQSGPISVPPGSTQTLTLPRGGSAVVQWNLARPLSADERPMGEELRGSAVIREPSGRIRQRASAQAPGAEYFAPLITNATDSLLRLTVNAGLEGAVDCACAVRPGARRVFIGYYRLYRNSTVRARNTSGRTATFRDLGPRVDAADGSVGLRFEAKDFR